jgi:glutamate racemase
MSLHQPNPISPQKSDQQAIGVMDSGVGGISVLKHIHALLPQEQLIYVADSQYAPYGNKTPQEITARCVAIADFLIAQHVKALVVACNTATAAAIDTLRQQYNIPIIGMEPAVKPAAAATQNGVIGVLATVGTLKSAQFAALLESYGRNVKVVTQACVGLVECVERGELNSPATKALIRRYTSPLLAEGADTLVLGCTHYPFVKDAIREIVSQDSHQKHISLIDTGEAVAKQLQKKLAEQAMLATTDATPQVNLSQVTFYTNSLSDNAKQVIEQLWGSQAKVTLF